MGWPLGQRPEVWDLEQRGDLCEGRLDRGWIRCNPTPGDSGEELVNARPRHGPLCFIVNELFEGARRAREEWRVLAVGVNEEIRIYRDQSLSSRSFATSRSVRQSPSENGGFSQLSALGSP